MQVVHANPHLARLELDQNEPTKLDASIVRAYRKVMRIIRDANDERDIRAMKSLRFEKLKGRRDGDYSLRLNDKMRLTFRILSRVPANILYILDIEDYH